MGVNGEENQFDLQKNLNILSKSQRPTEETTKLNVFSFNTT